MESKQFYFRKDGKLAIRIAGQEEAIVNIDSMEGQSKVARLMEIMGQQGQMQAFCRHLSEARKKNPEAWEGDGLEVEAFVSLAERSLSLGPAKMRFDERKETASISAYKDKLDDGRPEERVKKMSGAYKDDLEKGSASEDQLEEMSGAFKDDFKEGGGKIGTTEMSGGYKDDFKDDFDDDDEDDVR